MHTTPKLGSTNLRIDTTLSQDMPAQLPTEDILLFLFRLLAKMVFAIIVSLAVNEVKKSLKRLEYEERSIIVIVVVICVFCTMVAEEGWDWLSKMIKKNCAN